jgi:hypothetical protein
MLCFAPPLCSLDLTIHRLDCIAAPGNQQADNPLLFREISLSRLPCFLFFMNPVYSGGRDKHRSASKLYGGCSDYAAVFSAIAIHYGLMEGRDIRITAWQLESWSTCGPTFNFNCLSTLPIGTIKLCNLKVRYSFLF